MERKSKERSPERGKNCPKNSTVEFGLETYKSLQGKSLRFAFFGKFSKTVNKLFLNRNDMVF